MTKKNDSTRKKDVMTGEQFKELRESIGLTQAELAEEMGVYPPWVSRIESEYEGRKPTIMAVNFIKYIKKHLVLKKMHESLKKRHDELKGKHEKLRQEVDSLYALTNKKS